MASIHGKGDECNEYLTTQRAANIEFQTLYSPIGILYLLQKCQTNSKKSRKKYDISGIRGLDLRASWFACCQLKWMVMCA